MLEQPLSFITFLLMLCHHDVETKRVVVCEGGTAHLSCSLGFIKVLGANYGRAESSTCVSGQPSYQITNTHCFRETSLQTMSNWCDGMESCSVPATSPVFADPCPGTFKYLDVTYDCVPSRRSVTCEATESVIFCDTGKIFVHHANYGRRNRGICPHKQATTSTCFFPQTLSLRSRCNGRESCTVVSSDPLYSNPCPGIYKYLEISFSCI